MRAGAVLAPGSAEVEARLWPRWVDAVVLTGDRLDHYRRRLDRPDRPWLCLGTVTEGATGPGRLSRLDGFLMATVPRPEGTATYRLHPTGWQAAPGIAPAEPGTGAALRAPSAAELGADPEALRAVATFTANGWPQALTDEAGSVFGYFRPPGGSWERSSCLRVADPDFVVAGPESVKLAQITGEVDATPTPWGERPPTLSQSLSTAGIRGADLGVRVEHAGRTFLMFGDTHWTRRWLSTRDSIAEVTAAGPVAGLPGVRFHGSPLKLVGGRTTMREYDVPLDGFSSGGRLYGFFTSNHFRRRRVMGRSVLARAEPEQLELDPSSRRRPVRFRVLGTFSDQHFLNVSTQLVPAASVPGAGEAGEALLVWGTGPYRASEVRLALLDGPALARLDTARDAASLGVRYWTGTGWSELETQAAPLFGPAALGELSVRWVPAAGCYLMLTGSGPEDPIGAAITLRTAPRPQGPWSRRLRLLDWVAGGMSHADPFTRFIKAVDSDDPVGDRLFAAQAGGTGAAYAPYLFDATRSGDELVLRYTLSTWNPYQVVLMQHRVRLADLRKL